MAFNKAKALESALKYLNQGKVVQAIGEYKQILRNDPKDQATLMTVGDLYARQGDMPNAIEFFERLAQVYLTDGFNSKAIAIYKKIAKLAPNELAPLERLADLYVQQGVLSEARPLYLQIAEAHLKANHAPKAVEVLHRLLEVEPESPRVQMRLAELYNVLGQKKEAAQTYLNYAHRLLDRGEAAEAEKLAERATAVDAGNADAVLLAAKCLVAQEKTEAAVAALEKHPEADAGGEVTNMIVDLDLKTGNVESAADRARNQLLRGSSHCTLLHRVADALIEGGQAEQALPLLGELRDPMIEAGQQDQYVKSLSDAVQQLPGRAEPLETLADYCRTTSDPFRLTSTLNQLVEVYSAGGDYARAETVLVELIDRNKDDERLVERLNQLRSSSGTPGKAAAPKPAAQPEPEEQEDRLGVQLGSSSAAESETSTIQEEALDDDTQKFIAQALTDVDLFSSYGLTQKATHLLETILERAPRYTPTLERLLDFYLGAGNERRTAELASQLEQIYTQRGDTHNAERYSELRMRFQTAAGMSADELPAAPPPAPMASPTAAPADELPVPEAVAPAAQAASPAPQAAPAEFEITMAPPEPEQQEVSELEPAAAAPSASVEEVDLSDEWEAMTTDAEEPASSSAKPAPAKQEAAPEFSIEAQPEFDVAPSAQEELDPVVPAEPEQKPEPEPVAKAEPEPAPAAEDFDFELVEETLSSKAAAPKTTDDLISELVAELDDLEISAAPAPAPAQAKAQPKAQPAAPAKPAAPVAPPPAPAQKQQPAVAASASKSKPAATPPAPAPSTAVPEVTLETLNQLSEVFQEFRNELGGDGADEDEDLETHYNLGIAYREMGLLDEAIGEFQKVAKAVQKGKPFAYAMNCSAMLALCFTDKGEPKIASLWYQRALEMPDLDQEAILALRYDLAMSLEQAGEPSAALDSFRQVYAMNIDYRDVADRIATLQKR